MERINLESATQGIIFCRVDSSANPVQLAISQIGFGHLADIGLKLGQRVIHEVNNINTIPPIDIGSNAEVSGKRLRISALISKQTSADQSSLELTISGGIPASFSRGFNADSFDANGTVHYVIDVRFKN